MRRAFSILMLALATGCVAPSQSVTNNSTTGTLSPTFFATPSPVLGTFAPVHVSHAFAAGATEERSFDVPSSAGRLVLHMAIAGADPHACDRPNSATLALSDPFGKRYATLLATRTDFRSAPGTCDEETVTATLDAGTWTVAFSGAGPVQGNLDLDPS